MHPSPTMKSPSLILSGAILIMSLANAIADTSVSYHTIRVDDLDIFYREAGLKDAPTILLLHGLPSSSRMYQPLLESSLSEKYHLVARRTIRGLVTPPGRTTRSLRTPLIILRR